MNFEIFLRRRNLTLTSEIREVCDLGSNIMKESVDPHHSISHIERCFGDLDLLLRKEQDLKVVNMDVLLVSIIWHDCYRSTKKLTDGFLHYWFYELADGTKGSRMFNKNTKKIKINTRVREEVRKCILLHSTFPDRLPRSIESRLYSLPIEAKVLRDLDHLDQWSLERLEDFVTGYFQGQKITKTQRVSIDIWRKFLLPRDSQSRYYFKTSKILFNKRKPEVIKAINEYWESRN